jgi:hypothetical protein
MSPNNVDSRTMKHYYQHNSGIRISTVASPPTSHMETLSPTQSRNFNQASECEAKWHYRQQETLFKEVESSEWKAHKIPVYAILNDGSYTLNITWPLGNSRNVVYLRSNPSRSTQPGVKEKASSDASLLKK